MNKRNEWHTSACVGMPQLIDKSYKSCVAIRKNVHKTKYGDNEVYEFDEKYIPIEEWITYEDLILAHSELAKQRADIDYIMIMEDL